MRYLVIILALVFVVSCKSDDDDTPQNESRYPKVVNVRFEATPTLNNEAVIITEVGNTADTHNLINDSDFPFSFSVINSTVTLGTSVSVRYTDNTAITAGDSSPWTDHEVELKIFVDDIEVESEIFDVLQDQPSAILEYTFI